MNHADKFNLYRLQDLYNRVYATNNPFQKAYYYQLFRHELEKQRAAYHEILLRKDSMQKDKKVFTKEELALYDGAGDRPAYVAVDGKVYDVSQAPVWGGGTHFGLYAGNDVTVEFYNCHDSKDILNQLPLVGVLKEGGRD